MNTGDVIQTEAPDFDPDFNEALPIPTDQNIDHQETQGSVNSTQQSFKKTAKSKIPASSHQDAQDWLDKIQVEIPPQPDRDSEQYISTLMTQCKTVQIEIPQLETDPEEEEQSQDLQTYLTHNNTYEESQHIHREYNARLLELDDDRYYQEIDCVYQTYGPLPARDYIPTNQAPGPHHMTQSLCKYSARGEVRCTGKSSMDINLSEQEQDHCKVESSKRLRKHNICDRGM